jgi:hypothetical protein
MDSPQSTDPRTLAGEGTGTTQGAAFWFGTTLAAILSAALGVLFILPFGLIVIENIIFPLALSVGEVLSSLVSGWAGNQLAADHTRTQLTSVVRVTLAAALVLAVIFLTNAAVRLVILILVFYPDLFCALVVAHVSTIATARFRSRRNGVGDVCLMVWPFAAGRSWRPSCHLPCMARRACRAVSAVGCSSCTRGWLGGHRQVL